MKEKVWNLPPKATIPEELLRAGCTPLLAAVLASRGLCTVAEADAFLDSGPDTLSDPLLMADIMPAIGRITRAVQQKEKVAVYGDYDVDGITSACLLTEYLQGIGLNTKIYIPDRLGEGYGLNTGAIEHLRDQGVTLIITVDCGVTAVEETDFAASIGVDMVITDHHECRDILPNAVAVVDPKRPDCPYPSRDLAGVGVAFKLVCAMDGSSERMLERFSDLVTVGTIADVMPLTGENRRIVRAGLEKLRTNPRPGLAALIIESGAGDKRLNASTIGFSLAPRINAAGRLGRVAHAAELMMEQNPSRAMRLATELCDMNRERQRLETEAWEQALDMLGGTPPTDPIILSGEGWHQGVIGIAASRLAEAYCLPSIMISLNGDMGKGSCRSYGGFNLFDALSACGDLLESYGGHMLAAGLNIRRENIPAFREAFSAYYAEHIPDGIEGLSPDVIVDRADFLTMNAIRSLEQLEPCGNGNPRPCLCMLRARLTAVTPIGGGKHLRLTVQRFNNSYDCVWFSHGLRDLAAEVGDWVDLIFFPQISEFRGRRSVQLLMEDLRPADCRDLWAEAQAGCCEPEGFCLTRDILGRLWRRLEEEPVELTVNLKTLSRLDNRLYPTQLVEGLHVLEEVGLLTAERLPDDRLRLRRDTTGKKADLTASPTWRRYM